MNGNKLRLGIIGCGAITETGHVPAILSCSAIELTALCDTSERRLRVLERMFGLGSIGFLNYRDAFAHVDAVILALPNHLHVTIGCELLSKGIHVLCEKPLATSRQDCERLCQTAQSANAVLAVGYFTRFYPSTELTKRLLESRFLGSITSFDYEHGSIGRWAPHSGYNLSRATSGGGVLIVNGSHFIDRMLYLFGSARVVSFSDDSRGGVEANCVATFECNMVGHSVPGRVTLSKTHSLADRLRIIGEGGILEVGENQKRSINYYPAHSDLRHEIFPKAEVASVEDDYFRLQLDDFVQAVHTSTKPRVSGEHGLASVTLMETCYQMATPLEEPWVDEPLDRLKEVLPSSARQDSVETMAKVAVS
jgi:UDP-N-acetylglucosamine 3-dehydrogenase